MTSDNKVIPLHHHNTIEIDDSRLQAMWQSHNRRQGLLYGALGLAGVTGVLLGLAAIVWAVMSHQPTPQITVSVPKQPAPVVNITVPQQPQQRPSAPQPSVRTDGAPSVVTEYVIFKKVYVDNIQVETGWQYQDSTATAPYSQYCHAWIGATGVLQLGDDRQPRPSLATDAQALNLPEAQAQALLKGCQWYPG
jgi:hypothetical protein